MVRILWFKETSRWSRRGIPLRVVWVSPRQLAILLSSFLVGLLLATPLPTPTMKIIPVGTLLLVGLVVAVKIFFGWIKSSFGRLDARYDRLADGFMESIRLGYILMPMREALQQTFSRNA